MFLEFDLFCRCFFFQISHHSCQCYYFFLLILYSPQDIGDHSRGVHLLQLQPLHTRYNQLIYNCNRPHMILPRLYLHRSILVLFPPGYLISLLQSKLRVTHWTNESTYSQLTILPSFFLNLQFINLLKEIFIFSLNLEFLWLSKSKLFSLLVLSIISLLQKSSIV